jgi:tetraacyldisaccharide 4'-kinase
MKTPAFWAKRNLTTLLLWPASLLYRLGTRLRYARAHPYTASVPVICIGNATAGGAGKTPTAMAIGALLKTKGINPMFLSRGYGGAFEGAIVVDAEKHTAAHVGDEPLLLAGVLPTIVATDRVQGAKAAIARGAKLLIMDDGFQNPTITKTLSLLVIDSKTGFGNGFLLPAGPLRESPASAFARADAIIVIGKGSKTPALPEGNPVLRAQLAPAKGTADLSGKRVLAFCGIAYPEKFFDTLGELGAQIVSSKTYADHAPYTSQQIVALAAKAKAENAMLCTTSKDAARIPPDLRRLLTVVEVRLVFEDTQAVEALLEKVLA